MTPKQARERAFDYVNEDDLVSASSSILSDLNKIEGRERTPLKDIQELQMAGIRNDGIAVLRWITEHTGA